MSFNQSVKSEVLLMCKRHCCYCENYVGTKIEVHHIVPKGDGGKDIIDNAIPLCFNCHSEIGSYNPRHPKGNRFSEGELKRIRDEFYKKISLISRNATNLSIKDEELLEIFKNNYVEIIEYAIKTDFSSELINIDYSDTISLLQSNWNKIQFNNIALENLKIEIIENLYELNMYLTIDFFRIHEPTGNLIFRNQSYEEGVNLNENLRPNTLRIRKELYKLIQILNMYLIS